MRPSSIFVENSFLPKFGQKGPKETVFCIFLKILYFSQKQWKIKVNLILNFPLQTLYLAKSSLREKVQIRSYLRSVFFRIRTESVVSPNTEKYGPEIIPYLDTFHVVSCSGVISQNVLDQLDCKILWKVISSKKLRDQIDFLLADKH